MVTPTPRWSAGAPRTHPVRRASPPRGRSSVGGGGRRGPLLSLHHPRAWAAPPPPRLYPGLVELQARPGRGAVRTRLGQRVPCTPSPRGRRGRSLFLRISGLYCRVPCKPASAGAALRTLGGGGEGDSARITKPPAPPGRDSLIKPTLSRRAKNGSLPGAQSSKTSRPPRIIPARRNSRHHWGNWGQKSGLPGELGDRDASSSHLPILLLREPRSPFWPQGRVRSELWPAAGTRRRGRPGVRGTQVCWGPRWLRERG